MAILKMKRLRAAIPTKVRRSCLRELYSLGCVEVDPLDKSPELDGVVEVNVRTESTNAGRSRDDIKHAKVILGKYVPEGKKTLGGKPYISEDQLLNEEQMDRAVIAAEDINRRWARMEEIKAERVKCAAHLAYLTPWSVYDLPLEFKGTATTVVVKGSFANGVDLAALEHQLLNDIGGCYIKKIGFDRDLQYVFAIIHRSKATEVVSALRQGGFSGEEFSGLEGTAFQCIKETQEKISGLDLEYSGIEAALKSTDNIHGLLEQGFDAYTQEESRDTVLSSIGYTKKTALLTGWVPEHSVNKVEQVLKKYNGAYSFADPIAGEEPPTMLESSDAAQPLSAITEMYGMPRYDSLLDPNPLIMPFYILFFGAIMSDFMYGFLMLVGCLLGLKLMNPPRGNMRNMLKLFSYCGVSTMAFGVLSGSYFGDMIFVFSEMMTGTGFSIPPLWFSPLEEPMTMLVFSMVLGVIQILAGLAISGYRQVLRGKGWDALWDTLPWYLVFAGLGTVAIGFQYWYLIVGLGVAVMLLTGGRHSPTFFGKIVGGLGSLYGVTGYLSDILSYSRIMALGLSGAVVASVFNKMGAMGGNGIFGILLFILAAVIGHTFNLAISVLGAYVHTSRLQYIEYFGRFYEDGGRPMKPLKNKTKYVNIKE